MKKSIYSILFSISLFCFAGYIAAQDLNYPKKVIEGKEYYEYPVQKSEGFYSISKRFNVTQEEIKQVNPGTEKGLIDGAVLLIPVKIEDYISHKVEKKETLFSLTQKYNITYDELYALNPQLKKEGLKSGTEVKIPKKGISAHSMTINDSLPKVEKKNKPGFISHEVKKGETLYSISKTYETTTEEIVRLNPEAKNGVKIGKMLIIPPVVSSTMSGTNNVSIASTASAPKVASQPQAAAPKNKDFVFHEVKKEETLYSISKKYGISQDEIISLNPDVKEELKIGKILIIPPVHANTALKESNNSVKPQETALSSPADTSVVKPDMGALFVRSTDPKSTINIALALPFQMDKVTENSKIDGNTDKFLEFYQGMLLAVDSLKKQGLSFNLYVYDSGKSEMEIKTMLLNPELKNMDILIGPAYTVQIKPMSDFALLNNVKLIIPFSSKSEETKSNPNIFQINTPQALMNKLIADQFISHFAYKNIILLRFKTAAYDDKAAFADELEVALKAANVKYTTVWYDTMENIRKELSDMKENVIVTLTTNQVALSQALPVLNMLGDKKSISLFGFPEWQTYQSISKELFRLNTYIPSSFFVDYKDQNVKNYLKKYRYFYNAEPANIVPQYGLLGYDIVMYFSEAISKYGHDFEKELDQFNPKLLQMDFKFKQINQSGGYYNSNVYLTNHNDVTGLTNKSE